MVKPETDAEEAQDGPKEAQDGPEEPRTGPLRPTGARSGLLLALAPACYSYYSSAMRSASRTASSSVSTTGTPAASRLARLCEPPV